MLVNLTPIKFEKLEETKKQKITDRFGSILDLSIPVIVADNEINNIANDYFLRITAAIDTCANEPKENAVCMEIQTHLEKKIMSLLTVSKIEVLLSCF